MGLRATATRRWFRSLWGFGGKQTWGDIDGVCSRYAFTPAVESRWTDDELCLRAILPGVAEKDVKVSVQNDQLVIEGERKAPEGWGHSGYTQMAYGKFYGAVPLPSGLNLNKVSCRLHDGVLDIQIPVAEQMKPRHIPIQSGDSRKAISA